MLGKGRKSNFFYKDSTMPTAFLFFLGLSFLSQIFLLSPSRTVAAVLDDLERDLNGDGPGLETNGSGVFDVDAIQKLPNIIWKKQKADGSDKLSDPIKFDPPECVETTYMSPFHEDVYFPSESMLSDSKTSPYCKLNFVGSEVCTPKLSCPTFDLGSDCDQTYMLVLDGVAGMQKYCGTDGPKDVVASNYLRDLFVVINGTQDADISLNCTITCTHRGQGVALSDTFEPKVDKSCLCGQKSGSDRIVNGYKGRKTENPWLVAIVEAQTRQPFCGGSIINDRFILTAAHCFKGKFMDYRRVQLLVEAEYLDIMPNSGVLVEKPEPKIYSPEDLQKLDAGNGSYRHSVEEIFVHPLYVSETNDFDVAIVKVSEPFNITYQGQTPVCLPVLGSYGVTYAHLQAVVAGWGLPSSEAPGTSPQLQKLNVTVFSQKLCKEYYAHRINKRMMCAGYKEGGRDSCMGDSGSPLVAENSPRVFTQIGSVSWGEGCAVAENPGVYYRTAEVQQWINFIANWNDAIWCDLPAAIKKGK